MRGFVVTISSNEFGEDYEDWGENQRKQYQCQHFLLKGKTNNQERNLADRNRRAENKKRERFQYSPSSLGLILKQVLFKLMQQWTQKIFL